jgi:hypothetical protein
MDTEAESIGRPDPQRMSIFVERVREFMAAKESARAALEPQQVTRRRSRRDLPAHRTGGTRGNITQLKRRKSRRRGQPTG